MRTSENLRNLYWPFFPQSVGFASLIFNVYFMVAYNNLFSPIKTLSDDYLPSDSTDHISELLSQSKRLMTFYHAKVFFSLILHFVDVSGCPLIVAAP